MDPAEYKRRAEFCSEIKGFSRSEHIEIARILRTRGIECSENRSGLYFDLTKLPQEVFDELLQFRSFVLQNNAELGKRDEEIKGSEAE